MSAAELPIERDDARQANVIRLPRLPSHDEELARHARFLHHRWGPHWLELPEDVGKRLARAETLLEQGPIAIDPVMSPADAVARARKAARLAAAIGDIVQTEGHVLEAALSAHLVDLPLGRLSGVVDAVLALSTAPHAERWWASPAAARAADVVLTAHGDDLRESAQAHDAVYAQFTDQVWAIPERRLKRGRRAFRPLAWMRLRRALTATSRSMRAPRPLAPAADLVRHARALRARLEPVAALLDSHLGEHHRGPLTDVDAAQESLAAVRRLHAALGDRLDVARLARLLDADAFGHDAINEPARILHTALRAWEGDVAALGGSDALGASGPALEHWATLVEDVLPEIKAATAAVDGLGRAPATLRDLVNGLLARERFAELAAGATEPHVDAVTSGGAS
jgi:hypothetical protein